MTGAVGDDGASGRRPGEDRPDENRPMEDRQDEDRGREGRREPDGRGDEAPTEAEARPARGTRPRPRYGEYASPQDQAAAIASSHPPVSPLLVPDDTEPEADTPTGVGRVPAPGSGGWPPPTGTPSRGPRDPDHGQTPAPVATARRLRVDRILSIALLAYGLVTTLNGFAAYSDLGAVLDDVFAAQGLGDFSSDSTARVGGIALNLVNTAILAVVAAVTIGRLRARRRAVWVPLIGGVAAVLAAFAVLLVVITGDPAFAELLQRRS